MNNNISKQPIKKLRGKKCQVCPRKLSGHQTKYCSRKCHNTTGNRKYQNYMLQQDRAIQRKTELIKLKGGKCQKCDYNKNISALCFHHRVPKDREFGLDARHLSNSTWESILQEADKCDLLCNNCHAESHHPDLKFLTLAISS